MAKDLTNLHRREMKAAFAAFGREKMKETMNVLYRLGHEEDNAQYMKMYLEYTQGKPDMSVSIVEEKADETLGFDFKTLEQRKEAEKMLVEMFKKISVTKEVEEAESIENS